MISDLVLASPLLILAFVGLLALMAGVLSPRDTSTRWLGYVVSFGCLIALGAVWWLWGQPQLTFQTAAMSGSLTFDHFGLALAGIILLGTLLTSLAAVDYLPAQDVDHPEYYALVAFCALGMVALVTAGDLLTVFVALEVMSIGVYILAGFKRDSPYATESAMKYFIMGSFASAVLLLGIAFIYGVTGEITLVGISRAFHFQDGPASDPLAAIGMVLMLAAFAFKVAAAPFHMWVPDVYEGALSSVTGFMAVAVKTAAFGALARILLTCFGDEAFRTGPISWEVFIAGLAVASMLAGNLMALAQTNLKRMLAYSAVAHTGYLLLALVAVPGGELSLNALGGGLVIYLLGYTLANAAAFAVAAALGGEDVEDISEPAYAGLARRSPTLAFFLAVAMLSLLGIPATAGFVGKLTIFSELLADPSWLWLVVFAVVNSVISAFYYLRVILVAYMKDESGQMRLLTSRTVRFSAGLATVLTLAVGLLPGNALEASTDAGRSLARTTTPGLSGAVALPHASAEAAVIGAPDGAPEVQSPR
ncbi:MAG: NADH-quinone oxidoreductase subunit N [Deltaproteobacteria bacterium]|nr:NADH-quinone oxidoreductase subunit N [Deltaproteobacteria bacterium]